MATRFHARLGAAVFAGSLLVSTLAGCGTTGINAPVATQTAAQMTAQEATVLKKALERIHQGVFARLDVDQNKSIDEYEAGPQLSLADFGKADKNKNHKLTYSEFRTYAVTNLFFFKDSKEAFFTRFRRDLASVFKRLDENRDMMLAKSEVSNADLKKLRLTFEYPRLNISVKVQECSPEAFEAADRTKDSKLGQAEFEDFYVEAVVQALSPNAPPPAPTPDPAPAPADPSAPTTDPNAPPAAGEYDWDW